ncbi:MAG: hypothetical protein R3C14_35380 [Caldilineaceae bacterium]
MKQRRILLFDDDYESMAPLKLFLEEVLGFAVVLTAQADIGEWLAQERFDLLCIDLMIHPVSLNGELEEVTNLHFTGVNWQQTGLALLERIRQGHYHAAAGAGTATSVPVIVLSAVANQSIAELTVEDDPWTEYLEKPFDLAEMVATMERLLARKTD